VTRIVAGGLAAASLTLAFPTFAQTYHDVTGTVLSGVVPVGGDGSGPLFTAANPGKISGSLSASISGFEPTPSYSQLSVGTTSSRVALPAGSTVVVYNTGSVDAFVTMGGSTVSATTSNDVVKAGGWMALTVGTNSYLAAVTATGSTGLNISGGAGLPAGSGGASGGGGGTVIQGPAGSSSWAWFVQPGSGASFPVSATSLPLPAGAATAANQPAINADGGALAHVTNFPSTQAISATSLPLPSNAAQEGGGNLASINGKLTATANGLKVDDSGVTQPVSAASLPLPSGAASAANQATEISSLSAIATNTGSLPLGAATAANQTSIMGGGVSGAIAPSGSVVISGVNYGDSPPSLAVGSSAPLAVNSNGQLWVNVISGLPGGSNTIGKVDLLGAGGATLDSAAGTANSQAVTIQGNAGGVAVPISGSVTANLGTLNGAATAANQTAVQGATGASVPPSATLVGGKAVSAEPTVAANGQLVAPSVGLEGKPIVLLWSNKENFVSGTVSVSATTQTTLVTNPGSLKLYIVSVHCSQASGTTNLYGYLNDASTTPVFVPAGSGDNLKYEPPLVVSSGTNLKITLSAAPSSGNVTCDAQGYQGS
jgi:hypothetical protein